MQTVADLETLTVFLMEVADYSEDFEDDQFAIRVKDRAAFIERQLHCFRIEYAGEVLEIPRH